MIEQLPPWPTIPPSHGSVFLRGFTDADVHLAHEYGQDPYIPSIGSLPAHPTEEQALDWIRRQPERHTEGSGFSFVIADSSTGRALGSAGLWLRQLAEGRASVGYAVSPASRGRGVARSGVLALTEFAWTLPDVHRIELRVEPWNTASIGVAEAAGYQREGLLRSHEEIGGTRRDILLYASIRS